ncbi:hypothetical protein [Alteromonas antoniana]|uniref:hypothetical protein n=1 Tax=Alteromonas antoniana TaxID=2803813 RepID=UPI001C48CC39|nr:hypothetical protein [Alteromonas antoniana]
MKWQLCIVLLSVLSFSGYAQQRIDRIAICQGMGEAVSLIQAEREAGVDDSDNKGLAVISRISEHARRDLRPAIDAFISHTHTLTAEWTGTLYTHACIMNYDSNDATVSLMVTFIPLRCDIASADIHCAQEVYQNLPDGGII